MTNSNIFLCFIWAISSMFSLSMFGQEYWTSYGKWQLGLDDTDTITTIAVDGNDHIWLGTTKGIIIFDGKTWVKQNVIHDQVNCFYYNQDKNQMVTGTSNGIYVLTDPFSVQRSYKKENAGLLSDTILTITEDYSGNYWFGTTNSISVLSNSDWIHEELNISVDNTFFDHPVYFREYPPVTMASTKNWVYIGTKRGISRNRYDEIDGVTGASIMDRDWSGLHSNKITDIIITDNKNQWIGTEEALYLHESENTKTKWIRFSPGDGLVNNYVTSLAMDKIGNLWVGTMNGVSCVDTSSNWVNLNVEAELVDEPVKDIAIQQNNTAWFATPVRVLKYSGNQSITEVDKVSVNSANFRLHPNPVRDYFCLTFIDHSIRQFQVKIWNISGDCVGSRLVTNYGNYVTQYYKISDFSGQRLSGIYIVEIIDMINKNISTQQVFFVND